MRLLLDTHALVWWSEDSDKLGSLARTALLDESNEVFVSTISAYEMSLKTRLGKWPEAANLLRELSDLIRDQRFTPLPLLLDHALMAGKLPLDHRDPFDRMLIAQALVDDLTLVSNEQFFDRFGVPRLW